MIRVITILAVKIINRRPRHLELQFSILYKKRAIEIILAAEFERIPFVAPPTLLAINFKRFVRRVEGNDFPLAAIASVGMKTSLIPPSKSSLLPTLGTQTRRRDFETHALELWAHSPVKVEVGRGYIECFSAFGANFFHGLFMDRSFSTGASGHCPSDSMSRNGQYQAIARLFNYVCAWQRKGSVRENQDHGTR